MRAWTEDPFTRRARADGHAARSVYKLEEMDRRFRLLGRGDRVLDLGCAPGSWARYAGGRVGPGGRVVGVDLAPVPPRPGDGNGNNVEFLERDALSLGGLGELGLGGGVDVLLSDMAPGMSGVKARDRALGLRLVEKAFGLAAAGLAEGGRVAVKAFDCPDAHRFLEGERRRFERFRLVRPGAVRRSSSEFYAVGLGLRR